MYVTTSEIDGLVKIGKTKNLEKRMKELSGQGYIRQKCDMVYAIEVDDFDEKEKLLHTIFGKVRAAKTEFFAVDINVVVQTLSFLMILANSIILIHTKSSQRPKKRKT